MSDALSDDYLRSAGFRLSGSQKLFVFGISINSGRNSRGGMDNMLQRWGAVRNEYLLGEPDDPDVEMAPILMISDVRAEPLHQTEVEQVDGIDRLLNDRRRLAENSTCADVAVCIDASEDGDGALITRELRNRMPSTFPIRMTTDAALGRPKYNRMLRCYEMSGDALISGLTSRVKAGQITIDPNATDAVRRQVIEALRSCRSGMQSASPGARILAWMTEVSLAGQLIGAVTELRPHAGRARQLWGGGMRRVSR